jgi:hypothetical protein
MYKEDLAVSVVYFISSSMKIRKDICVSIFEFECAKSLCSSETSIVNVLKVPSREMG